MDNLSSNSTCKQNKLKNKYTWLDMLTRPAGIVPEHVDSDWHHYRSLGKE